jgi:hypothetical protein
MSSKRQNEKLAENPEGKLDINENPEPSDKEGRDDYWIWCEKGLETVWLTKRTYAEEEFEDGTGAKHKRKVVKDPGQSIIVQNWCGVEMLKENQLPGCQFPAALPKKYSLTKSELKKVKEHFKKAKMRRYNREGKEEFSQIKHTILKISVV